MSTMFTSPSKMSAKIALKQSQEAEKEKLEAEEQEGELKKKQNSALKSKKKTNRSLMGDEAFGTRKTLG